VVAAGVVVAAVAVVIAARVVVVAAVVCGTQVNPTTQLIDCGLNNVEPTHVYKAPMMPPLNM
jgi:hypothetical protein